MKSQGGESFGLWEELRIPGQNRYSHGENMQTPQGARWWIQTQDLLAPRWQQVIILHTNLDQFETEVDFCFWTSKVCREDSVQLFI